MRSLRFPLLLAVVVLGIGILAFGFAFALRNVASRNGAPSERVRSLLGDRAIKVLTSATRVEAFRVDPRDFVASDTNSTDRVGGYRITATAPEQGRSTIDRLRLLLLDDGSYVFETAKGCTFQPGVAFRLHGPSAVVEILLCFSCDEWRIVTRDAAGVFIMQGTEDFDPVRPQLVRLARDAFPNDPVVQALTERDQ